MGPKPRVVFDCMVFLQAAAGLGSPSKICLSLFDAERIDLYVSPAVLSEVEEVLSRPKLQRKFPTLTPKRVAILISDLKRSATIVKNVPNSISYSRDPKDEPYLNLALISSAEYLVTWDKDLLDLEKPKSQEETMLRDKIPGSRILNPVAFLHELSTRRWKN